MSVIIKTERLILREFEINDAGKFTEICNQEHILKWMPDWKMTEFQVEGWIKRSQQSYS